MFCLSFFLLIRIFLQFSRMGNRWFCLFICRVILFFRRKVLAEMARLCYNGRVLWPEFGVFYKYPGIWIVRNDERMVNVPYIVEVYDETKHVIESVLPVVYPDKEVAFRGAKSSGYYDTSGESPYVLKLVEVAFHPWGWGLYSVDVQTGKIIPSDG